MNCDHAQALLSARMDGEHVRSRVADTLEGHVAGCRACRSFAERSAQVRTAVRIRPAEPVPDLVDPIMEAIRLDPRPHRGDRRPGVRRNRRGLVAVAPAVAAAVVGALVGSLIVGGPWERPSTRPIAAAAVVRGVRAAAPSLEAFHATFSITERGLSPSVPERRLDMQVWFLAPQRFRLEVRDRTTYPSSAWTPTNLVYVEDAPATYRSGPTGCPGGLAPGVCPPTRITVSRASPFSAAAPLPTDLIVPIATLGTARGVRVVGPASVDGRDAIHLELSVARAAPLFPFLRLGGTWRPLYEADRVELWLDAETWFPLRTTVFPSADPARRAWEFRFGRPVESPDRPIIDVRATSVDGDVDASRFAIPGLSGARDVSLPVLAGRLGYRPATPASTEGLRLVAATGPTADAEATPSSLLVYARGLEYVRLGERRGWHGPGPFGPLDPSAQLVRLPSGGVAYYEPSGDRIGRRISIHTPGRDLYLESNLPRAALLAIASSLPVAGEPLPRDWVDVEAAGPAVHRVSAEDALAAARIAPSFQDRLPAGYVVASAEVESAPSDLVVGVTLHLRQPELDAVGAPVTVHVEPLATLPPAWSADQVRVPVDGTTGRWTPSRSQLEWVAGGTYVSVQGEVDLRGLLAIARAVEAAS